MKKSKTIIIAIVFLLIALGLALYPLFAEAINKELSKSTIIQYNNQVESLTEESKSKLIQEAEKYNNNLSNVISDSFSPDAFKVSAEYDNVLRITDDGLIGSVTIPKIECSLPIYHGSSEKELDKGAVHMANTSFPIGGESTHAVISAHTAYPGKEFFNRLTELEKDDVFKINVLDLTLYYKVTDIYTVLPNDSEKLTIVKGKDLCTLVTCTPYSVNTHRLLVRGERIYPHDMTAEEKETLETKSTNSFMLTIFIIIIILLILIISIIIIYHRRKKKDRYKKIVMGGSGAGAARFGDLTPIQLKEGDQHEEEKE